MGQMEVCQGSVGQRELCQGFPRVERTVPEHHGAEEAVPGLPQGRSKLCQSLPLRGHGDASGLL